MKLSARDQIIVGVAAIILLVAGVVVGLIMPQTRKIASIDQQIQQVEQERASAEALLRQRQDAKAAAADTDARLLRLSNRVPDNPELPSLIIELQDCANQAGLEFTRLAPAEVPVVRTGYTAVPIDLTVVGRWSDTMDFLRRVKGLTREVRVLEVEVRIENEPSEDGEEAQDTKSSPSLTTKLKLEAYVLGVAGVAVPGAGQ